MPALDHQLIRTLRHSRGYSSRQVADHLGVTGNVVDGIEKGTNHDDLPVRLLVCLADILGVAVGRLFADQPTTDPDNDLVRKIGAALVWMDRPIRIEAIAEICGATLDQTRQALEELKRQVWHVGGAIAESDEGVRLHADQTAGDDQAVAAAVRWIHARHGLTPTEALLLEQYQHGELRTQYFTGDDHIAYSRLINAGLVEERT
jgi:transcriptional regulator with XRE-family HTH domain